MNNDIRNILTPVITGLVIVSLGSLILMFYQKYATVEVRSHGGSFSEGFVGAPRFINPVLAQSQSDKDMTKLVFSSLLEVDQLGSINYFLAENISVSANQREYTLDLNPKARFSDGVPITAQDLVFTVNKIQSPLLKSPLFNQWIGVSAEATGLHQVVFRLSQPYADFIHNLDIGILPEHLWKNISDEAFIFNKLNSYPISSGSYRVSNLDFDEQGNPLLYTLEKNPYALKEAYINTIHIRIYPDREELLKAYQKNDIDAVFGLSMADIKHRDHIHLGSLPRVFGIFFNVENNKSTLTSKTRVALNYGINRERLVNEVFGGYAYEVDNPLGILSETNYDPLKAQNLLEEDGWRKNSEGEYFKSVAGNNTPLSFKLSIPNISEIQTVANLIKEDLNNIGADLLIETYQEQDFTNEVIRARNYDALLFGYVLEKASDSFAFWHSSQKNDPGLNISMYDKPKIDGALLNIRNQEDRADDLEAFNQSFKEDMPAIFLYSPQYLYQAPAQFTTPESMSQASDRFNNIASWYQRTRHVWGFLVDNNH